MAFKKVTLKLMTSSNDLEKEIINNLQTQSTCEYWNELLIITRELNIKSRQLSTMISTVLTICNGDIKNL